MAKRVLIVDDSRENAELVQQVLEDEGLEAPAVVGPADVVAEVQAHEPDAVALSLPPYPDQAGEVLDALRTDPVARQVPLLASATVEGVADAATASYTVQETIGRPFDLEELVEKVERTLRRPPIQALVTGEPADTPAARVEPALAEQSRAALLRWVKRLRAEQPWADQPEARVSEVLDGAPAVVDALDASLRLPEPATLLDEHPEAAERLRARAAEPDGAAVSSCGRLQLLRDELWALLARELAADPAADAAAVERAFNESLDRIVELTVPGAGEVGKLAVDATNA